ncbi:Rha family transcriptional regulator [Serratia marcescens]|nr:Rha family transcriptional regulator [Serratia marcescens]MBN3915849.1 Rha family transcriptional regulator [Serratia marcescens]MBN3921515.1 Rha family transcriptional regulator [Serratia marcescens]MBN3938292.1 Rha family transcriptional regulator [Serratia marcescens]MBN3957234.1 Rha family transcriptional regulator [Serratia marcescens]
MGSRGIANAVDKEHKQVVRDIKTMLEQLGIDGTDLHDDEFKGFLIVYKEYNGRTVIDEIWLDETLSTTLVAGYDVHRRLALVKQWQAMKVELAQPRLAAPAPAPQSISASDHILSVARVVAEATASATMKAVMELSSTQVFAAQALPTASPEPAAQASILSAEPVASQPTPEFSPVIDLMWAFGISDAACRRLASYANLPTKLTNGERGHLLIHHASFADAIFALIDESTAPTGKRKRWQHPGFGGFTLKVTEANKAAVEAKQ